jgi:hypothetical protein
VRGFDFKKKEAEMERIAVAIAVLLLLSVSQSWAVEIGNPGSVTTDTETIQEQSKKDACECCQKCKAAKSQLKAKEPEASPITDPCKDCCDRCGTVLQPAPEDIPPDMIDKRRTPDIIEKGKE